MERFSIPLSAFEELHFGLLSDISFQQFRTRDELMAYCRRVAGVVGLLVAPITGYRGRPDTLNYAVALGNALQLTNIQRDVGEDLIRGRRYLPAELLDKYDVSIDEFCQGRVGQGYVTLLGDLATQARGLHRLGWKWIPRLHGIAALSYEGILVKLEKNQYDNLASRAYLRPLERFAIDEERQARKVTQLLLERGLVEP